FRRNGSEGSPRTRDLRPLLPGWSRRVRAAHGVADDPQSKRGPARAARRAGEGDGCSPSVGKRALHTLRQRPVLLASRRRCGQAGRGDRLRRGTLRLSLTGPPPPTIILKLNDDGLFLLVASVMWGKFSP